MDIFGKALLGYYNGQTDTPLKVLRDDGWTDEHSPALYFQEEPFAFEAPALRLIDGPTLDLGCGAGRHLRWLGAHGHAAFGLDSSDGALAVCRAQGLTGVGAFDALSDQSPELPFVPAHITLFGNNIGIGGSFEGSATLLHRLREICAEDGQLLLTGINVRGTDNPRHLAYHARNLDEGRRRGELKLRLSYEGEIGPEFGWFHPEPHEIEELAALSGWTVIRLEPEGGFFWASLRAR
ncbi:methyltransferase domain-containing protein [Dinoroseobacter sp. S76]|uniref:methyltransferase domain-containing protein n=1 Tax=Dinoroseobacter sp. S76 TaxID=3415124 RepID=UPI003C7B8230